MYINTIARLIDCLTLQVANLGMYLNEVGATVADVTRATQHLKVVEDIIAYCELYDANKKTAFGIKDLIINGPVGETVAVIPATPTYDHPVGTISGIMAFTNSKNRVFEEGPGYNDEIGTAIGIVVASPSSPDPGTVQPTLTFEAAQNGGYAYAFIIGNRGESTFWRLYTAPINSSNWTQAESGTGKTGEGTGTPTTPGQPMQLQARALLYKNNEPYGVYSAIQLVTLTP